MRYFCTYFDQNYLTRALAMYESLKRNCSDFKLWVLCLDDVTHRELTRLNLSGVILLTLGELEHGDAALLEAKKNRSPLEYYFTCTPSLPLFVLNHNPEIDLITYLDADLFFFSNIQPIFEEIGDRSVAIIPHRFTAKFKKWEWNGVFNVGWVSFRRDENGLAGLHWWRERCIEWCYDRVEDNRFADQKYLDDWPARFANVAVLQHKGANLAPWNIGNYEISSRDGSVLVDGQPLIFFHFHSFKQLSTWVYDTQLAKYKVVPSSLVVRKIYAPYLRELTTQAARLGSSRLASLRMKAGWRWNALLRIPTRQYLVVINGRVF